MINEETIEELKKNNYEFIEVIGFEVTGRSSRVVCKCQCGNIFKKKLYEMKNLSVHCGCKKSFLLSRAFYRKVESDPTYLKRRGKSYSKWCKEHPEKRSEQGKRHSEWYKNNPEKAVEQGRKHSEWYKNNPDKNADLSRQKSEWFKNNPEKVEARSEKYSKWCKDNPDKVKEKSEKYSLWCTLNKDANENRGKSISAAKTDFRIEAISKFSDDELSKMHPDDLNDLISGAVKAKSRIRTVCPNCGEYEYHLFNSTVKLNHHEICDRLCSKCKQLYISHYESELYDYITSLGVTNCIRNDRTALDGLELDLYIPDKLLAIEFNGSYWHNENRKGKYYHYDKFLMCLNKGIRLISIYEYDYIDEKKRNKILNIIKHAITRADSVIYARNCCVNKLDSSSANLFLEQYHIDGKSKQCSINYGLYYKNTLLAVMSFGKLRLQNKMRNLLNHYELVRYATLPDVEIVGGMTKLFSRFIKEYSPEYILCYSDNDYFNGDSYKNLGFSLSSRGRNAIDYNWVKKDTVLLRQQCMPCKLLKRFPDYASMNINGSVEKYIMEDLGYNRVYRCGNSKWEWYK